MDNEKRQRLYNYISNQIVTAEDKTRVYTHSNNKTKPNRDCFALLRKYSTDYQKNVDGIRMIILYGLRGTGKTTLLSQMYNTIPDIEEKRKLFLSLDEVVSVFDVNLIDVLDVYQEILGQYFEQLKSPIFLFLDEVHFDKDWSSALKILYDKTNKVFVIATGSSAVSLQGTADIARRSIFIELYPMKFTEYMKIKYGLSEEPDLSSRIKDCVFGSRDAEDVYHKIQSETLVCKRYWYNVPNLSEIDEYIKYNNLPFAVKMNDQSLIGDQIQQMIDRVIRIDVPSNGSFSFDVVSKIPELLYLLASSDQCNLSKLSTTLNIARPTLSAVLRALEKSGLIWRLYPYGTQYNQARQPSKYLFTSSAVRASYFTLTQNIIAENNDYMGKLFEDTVGLVLKREILSNFGRALIYDNASGGADFILQNGKQMIVLEVGYGRKRAVRQVVNTMRKIDKEDSMGIVISKNPLKLHKDLNIIEIPLTYFLLI